ncbi:hypothetical protein OIY81_1162 [Cryptosporidium canis]|nr:hypothetical protein OIY81_1162 [Cryptosporidium canis]
MNDSENIENLVGLLKKVERRQRREEFEKYKRVSDEIQHELKHYLIKFHQIAKKSEKKAIEKINNEYKQEERRVYESLEKIKEMETQLRENLQAEGDVLGPAGINTRGGKKGAENPKERNEKSTLADQEGGLPIHKEQCKVWKYKNH